MISVAAALLTTAGGLVLLLPVLRRAEVLDVPNGRSSHSRPIPRGGGVAVVLGILIALGVGTALGALVPWPLVIAGLTLAGVGLADDLRTLGSGARLAFQALTAVGVAAWAMAAYGGSGVAPVIFLVVSAIGLVAYVNAFNFMDGINGISALNAAVAGGWFAWLGDHHGVPGLVSLGLAVVGSSLAFLPFNAPDARIFLGDVGSYAVGLLLGGMAVVAWSSDVPGPLCVAPFTLYLADTAWVLAKRVAGHRPLTEAHREHVYQRLVDGGWTHLGAAALTAAGAVTSCGVVAIGTAQPLFAGLLTVVLVLAYLLTPELTAKRPAHARVGR